MKLFYLGVALVLGVGTAAPAQNLNFEQVDRQTHKLAGWWSAADNGYRVTADSVVRHEGRYALRTVQLIEKGT
ncbi:hypothetical protein [Hymenobacter sp.]|jgi:hypothetical protein|uniref:hypothetical protein n=1 Tax=Hymenobacter sp. TaxID=1898978 RepID=UPI002EDB3609